MEYFEWFPKTKAGDHAFILTKEGKIYEVEIIQFRYWHFEMHKMVVKETPQIPDHKDNLTSHKCDSVRVQMVESGIVFCVIPVALFSSKADILKRIEQESNWSIGEIPDFMKLDLTLVLQ